MNMKATGIIRRVDDLGRVIIPKEIRRTMRIREGDSLEIFLVNSAIMFKKYVPLATIPLNAAKSAMDKNHITSAIVDIDGNILAGCKSIALPDPNCLNIQNVRYTMEYAENYGITPILSNGEVEGAIIFCSTTPENVSFVEGIAAMIVAMLEN